jgi:arylsulfatase A-like enzyme
MARRASVRFWFSLVLMLAIVLFGVFILVRTQRIGRPNVLWITMDSMRADHLGCAGYERAITPHIDDLARQGALFAQCISQSNYTNISVPSMITGKYPALVDVRTPLHNLNDLYITVAEILSQEGYATSAIVPDWPSGINQGFENVHTLASDTAIRTKTCMDILDALDDRPFFIWLYYWDPHAPYQPPGQFATLFEPADTLPLSGQAELPAQDLERWRLAVNLRQGVELMTTLVKINEGRLIPEPGYGQHLINLYDGEIAFVDSEIEQVIQRIKKLGAWDRTLVILDADHGESFGEHGYFFHGYSFYEPEVRVPLIVKPPRSLSQGKVISAAVRNLDITPTILDYCGVKASQQMNGQSLRPHIEGRASSDLPACLESNTPEKAIHLAAYRADGYKVIYRRGGPMELYDLTADPGERVNLLQPAGATPDRQAAAARREAQMRQALLLTYGVKDVEDLLYTYAREQVDPQNRERLKALGYIY